MKQPTKAQLAENVTRLSNERTLLGLALTYVVRGAPEATETYKDIKGGGKYRFELYASDRASGGVVVVTSMFPNQQHSVDAFYLDDMYSRRSTMDAGWAIAVERLYNARKVA